MFVPVLNQVVQARDAARGHVDRRGRRSGPLSAPASTQDGWVWLLVDSKSQLSPDVRPIVLVGLAAGKRIMGASSLR